MSSTSASSGSGSASRVRPTAGLYERVRQAAMLSRRDSRNGGARLIRVMVSSTFLDLREERDAIRSVLADLGRAGWNVEPVAMEDLGASPSSPQQISIGMAEQTDLIVLLLGGRYGTVPSDEALSLTTQEYETIRRQKIPCLAYAGESPADEWLDPRALEFRRRVREEVTTKPYSGVAALAEQFRCDLEAWLSTFVPSGVARAQGLDTPPGPPLASFVNRADELRQLDEALTGEGARVGIWGPSGYGKTALVQRYFETHSRRLHDPLWLRVDDLFGRDPQGQPRVGAVRWEKEVVLERLLSIAGDRPRMVLVFDNVQAAPPFVHWLTGRLGKRSAIFLSWDAEALPPCRLIPLQPLPSESADELIVKACAPDQFEDSAKIRSLCERLENHPLLVDLAARRLRLTPSLTVSELTEELEAAATRLELEGPALDGRIVQVRGMVLSSYRCMDLVERRVLSTLAAVPPSGISDATMEWALTRSGRGELQRLDRAEHLGLLEGRTSSDWRGHRFRLRSLVRDFLQTTDAFQDGQSVFEDYLMQPDSLRDESVEVVSTALERQLAAAAPDLPHEGEWVEPLLVAASPAMRARVQSLLSRIANRGQISNLVERIKAVLAEPQPEDVTVELLRTLGRWKVPAGGDVLLRLWREPVVAGGTGEPWLSRDVRAAAGHALAEVAEQSYSDFVLTRIEDGSSLDREAAFDAAAYGEMVELRPALTRCLDDADPRIRGAAAESLGGLEPDARTQDRLWELFEDDPDPLVRDRAAGSLGVLMDDRVVDYFLRKLDDADPGARGQACSILWRFRSPRAADALAELARHDPEPGTRGTATFVLADWRDPRAAAICLERLTGPDDYERAVAAGMVAMLARPPGISVEVKVPITEELVSWLDDEPITLRLLARAALVAFEDERSYRGLWSDVSYEVSGGEGSYRWFVIRQLAEWIPEGFEPLRLRPLLHDREPDMRSSAALVAGQLRSRELIADLKALLDDPGVGSLGPVAKEAREALDRIAGKRPPWEPAARGTPFGG
jgi:HEAT repeat protein